MLLAARHLRPTSLLLAARRHRLPLAPSLSSLAAPATPAGSMNVTRHNFEANFADLKRDIELPSCRFVAIDTEFTGLSPDERQKERFLGAFCM